jgi:hypothetical protein
MTTTNMTNHLGLSRAKTNLFTLTSDPLFSGMCIDLPGVVTLTFLLFVEIAKLEFSQNHKQRTEQNQDAVAESQLLLSVGLRERKMKYSMKHFIWRVYSC